MDYAVADLHFSHSNILKHCHRTVFMTPEERAVMDSEDVTAIHKLRISRESTEVMDRVLLESINQTVKKNDRLFILGDFCWVRGPLSRIEEVYRFYRKQIVCENCCLLFGNHDGNNETKNERRRQSISKYFTKTADLLTVRIGDKTFTLCHYSMLRWPSSHHPNNFHFFAHSHATLTPWLDIHIPGYKGLDVGVDSAYQLLGKYRPFSFDEAVQIILSKSPS